MRMLSEHRPVYTSDGLIPVAVVHEKLRNRFLEMTLSGSTHQSLPGEHRRRCLALFSLRDGIKARDILLRVTDATELALSLYIIHPQSYGAKTPRHDPIRLRG